MGWEADIAVVVVEASALAGQRTQVMDLMSPSRYPGELEQRCLPDNVFLDSIATRWLATNADCQRGKLPDAQHSNSLSLN